MIYSTVLYNNDENRILKKAMVIRNIINNRYRVYSEVSLDCFARVEATYINRVTLYDT